MADRDERAPFQIRDFPVALREEIVREAKTNDVSVSDFMTGLCLAAREAGWSRATRLDQPRRSAANGLSNSEDAVIADKIVILIEAACRLGEAKGVGRRVRVAANRTLEHRLASFDKLLPAPSDDVGPPLGTASEQ